MTSAVGNSLNAALLTGSSVGISLPSSVKQSQYAGLANSMSGLTGSSLIAASLGGSLDIQSLVSAATGTSLSDETLAAINKALADNPYSAAMLQSAATTSLYGGLSGASSLYQSTVNLLTNAYTSQLPAKYQPVDKNA